MAFFAADLLPRALRAWAWLLLAVAVALVAVLGVRYAGQATAGPLDRALDRRLAGTLDGHRTLLEGLVLLGTPGVVVAGTLLLAAGLGAVRRGRAVLLALAGPALAGLLTEVVLKPLVGRTKSGGLAFPSGHTAGAFSLALVGVLVLVQPDRLRLPGAVRVGIGLGALLLAGGTATALVALRYHYATDALGGAGVAVIAVLGAALVLDAHPVARRLTRPPPPTA